MVHKLAVIIIDSWQSKSYGFFKDYHEAYVYGLEIILLEMLGILNIIIIGVMTQKFIQSIIFLITFISIRQFTGGYHAKSSLMCNIYFALVFLVNILITHYIILNLVFLIFLTAIFGLTIIYLIGPVDNNNKIIDINNMNLIKLKALIAYTIFLLVSIISIKLPTYISSTILVTLLQVAILMIEGYLIKKERRKVWKL